MNQEVKMQLIDMGIIIVTFLVAIFIGNLFVDKANNALVGFYLPSVATLTFGGTIWLVFRKWLIKKWEEADKKRLVQ